MSSALQLNRSHRCSPRRHRGLMPHSWAPCGGFGGVARYAATVYSFIHQPIDLHNVCLAVPPPWLLQRQQQQQQQQQHHPSLFPEIPRPPLIPDLILPAGIPGVRGAGASRGAV
ncbi:unnamed protein product [Arctogadus glacialis]